MVVFKLLKKVMNKCFYGFDRKDNAPQRVLIDITRLLYNTAGPRGTSRTVEAYWQHYHNRACAVVWVFNQLVVLSPCASILLFSFLVTSKQKKILQAWFIIFKEWLLFYGSRNKTHGCFFFNAVGHTGVDSERYHDLLHKMGVIPIFMIHDLIPIHYPQYCSSKFQKHFHVGIKLMLERATGLLTNSFATKEAVLAYAPTQCITRVPSLLPVHHGLSTKTMPTQTERRYAKPYFVVLGAVEPRKNHLLLLRLWQRLLMQPDVDVPSLLIIGQMTSLGKSIEAMINQSEGLKGSVLLKPNLDDDVLTEYLYHAQALLFPTIAEGYGFPIIEALSLGVPVIASDLPVFREFAGDIPEYIDPFDEEKWLEMVCAYSDSDHIWRQNQLQRLVQFTAPSWDMHFRRVDEFLETLQ